MGDVLTTAEVAAVLHITRQAVIARVAAGTLTPCYKQPANGGYLFAAADVDPIAAVA
jgi:hypothetical protein